MSSQRQEKGGVQGRGADNSSLLRRLSAAVAIVAIAIYYYFIRKNDASSLSRPECRCFPGDACWPSSEEWAHFNQSIAGKLIAYTPPGAVCHDPTYDAEKCGTVRKAWMEPDTHAGALSSPMMPLITNDTCDPFAPRAQPCTLGNHVSYVVNVTESAHITSTLAFARKNNIRVVIHNTGHDFFGKSTGAGAIAIWTHHLKDVQVREYNDPVYSGKALKMGAGIQARDAYKAADKYDAQVVGGQCPTVGLAGGYTMGGGHSLLASTYGLAADQVLEWEVIDSNGRFMVANRTHNSDLYWALCGGGGGTFGVVWSMTVKAHRPTPISGVNLMYTNEGISQDTFWKAFERWYTVVPSLADAGAECIFSFTNTTFSLEPITAPNVPIEHVKKLLQPFTDYLEELGVKYTMDARQFPKFFDFYNAMIGNTPVGNSHFGSWLLPRKVVESKRHDVVEASRYIANNGGAVTGFGLNVSPSVVGDIDNAVPPAWREALVHYLMGVPWELGTDRAGKIEHHARLTHDFIPRLRALAPDSGAYVNEGDFQQPDFQRVFYGKNYPRLKKIKEKYDPHGLFWGLTAVGSEGWTQRQDGRLCRT